MAMMKAKGLTRRTSIYISNTFTVKTSRLTTTWLPLVKIITGSSTLIMKPTQLKETTQHWRQHLHCSFIAWTWLCSNQPQVWCVKTMHRSRLLSGSKLPHFPTVLQLLFLRSVCRVFTWPDTSDSVLWPRLTSRGHGGEGDTLGQPHQVVALHSCKKKHKTHINRWRQLKKKSGQNKVYIDFGNLWKHANYFPCLTWVLVVFHGFERWANSYGEKKKEICSCFCKTLCRCYKHDDGNKSSGRVNSTEILWAVPASTSRCLWSAS